MTLTRPIPKAAMSIVRILRRDVKRPRMLPQVDSSGYSARWDRKSKGTCAMGLHPKAGNSVPLDSADFPPCKNNRAIKAFYRWHDEQTDAQALVDAIWPRRKRKGGAK